MTPVVDIDEPYLILNQGRKPSFKVNEEAIFKLVRGTGLYSSKFDCIREILQNAVDSTLHRIWIEHKDEVQNLIPTDLRLQEIYDNYKMTITFEPKEENSNQWILKVKDQGIGISFNDLKYMLEIGSSFQNKDKQKRIREMPKWFRPSGAFGIGLQSAYLLSNKFTMITKSLIDNQNLKITFNNKIKSVIIEKINKNINYGTEFTIEIDIEKLPQNIYYSYEQESLMDERLKGFDFTDKNSNLSFVETIKVTDSINNFLLNSPISSNLNTNKKDNKVYFDQETSILFNIIEFGDFDSRNIYKNYFRGQDFSDLYTDYECINYLADFYHTKSDNFLTYNREKILPNAAIKAEKLLRKGLCNYIEKFFYSLTEEEKIYASFSYIVNLTDKKYNDIDAKFLNYLDKFPIKIDNKIILLKDLLDEIKREEIKTLSIIPNYGAFPNSRIPPENIISNESKSGLFHTIKFLITKDDYFYSEEYKSHELETISFNKNDIQPISNVLLKKHLIQKTRSGLYNIGCRIIFPAWSIFRGLSIKDKISWADIYRYSSYKSDLLVLPLNFKYNLTDKNFYEESEDFINWIFEHRKYEETKIEDIRKLNKELIEHIRKILQDSAIEK
jgi:hypothetical protein